MKPKPNKAFLFSCRSAVSNISLQVAVELIQSVVHWLGDGNVFLPVQRAHL